jgi:nucleoside-diphosphate-sugar epimerase
MKHRSILITGGNGFVGRALCARMQADDWYVRRTVRSVEQATSRPSGVDTLQVESISTDTDWSDPLTGVDTVVHLAARVHVLHETAIDPLTAFRQVNVAGTERLALMAVDAGVRRFVFLSSVGVNGNVTHGRSFTEENEPNPHNPYALSKLEAEQVLRNIATESEMEVVIIRSPLVYGPNNPGNFLRLLRFVAKGFPLPLGAIENKRNMIYVGNLVDAMITCLEHPKATGETFMVSDGEDVSTPQLIRMIAAEMNRSSRLVPVPPALLKLIGKVTGKSAEVERLTSSLCVDSSKIRRMLNWQPPFTMEEGIKETVKWFSAERSGKRRG